jgi:hypothetical protein
MEFEYEFVQEAGAAGEVVLEFILCKKNPFCIL